MNGSSPYPWGEAHAGVPTDGLQEDLPLPGSFSSTVSIFFSDIRGFTEFADQHGDEAAYRMLKHYNNLAQELIILHDGGVIKTLGDSFMACFSAARSAMACAVAMQAAVERYNETGEGPPFKIGIGINTGEPIQVPGDLFGCAVNLASRICGAAGPGAILISEAVHLVAGQAEGARYIDLGLHRLKGFKDLQHLYELDWSSARGPGTTPAEEPARTGSPGIGSSLSATLGPRDPVWPGRLANSRGFSVYFRGSEDRQSS